MNTNKIETTIDLTNEELFEHNQIEEQNYMNYRNYRRRMKNERD